jgi:hypothetical protein
MLTVSKVKTGFSRVVRGVIKTRKPVVVRAPAGLVQIVPYDLPEEVAPVARGSLNLTAGERRRHNRFGESS